MAVFDPPSPEENDELMTLDLDILDERREAAKIKNWSYQQKNRQKLQ